MCRDQSIWRSAYHAAIFELSVALTNNNKNISISRNLDEASKLRFASSSGGAEVWFHEACGVWAPGLLAAGSRLWGLAPAVCGARGAKCASCGKPGAALTCAARACKASTHVPCASTWSLGEDFRALCPRHA